MRLLVTGGTGFIGRPLCRSLTQRGHQVMVLTRRPDAQPSLPGTTFLPWDTSEWQHTIGEVDGVINLAGEPIATKRWTPRQKLRLWESRVGTTHQLISTMAVLPHKPAVLIHASAVGYYGARGDEEITETDSSGSGFLADLCQAWEAEAQRAEKLGVRVVRLRIGVVLALGGGALAKLVPPFRGFVGGPLGNGRQWMSWVHRDDLIGLIHWALSSPSVSGAVNGTAPEPVQMRELAATLAQVLRRPSWAPVPAFVLRLLLGEMADMLLSGQRVIPQVALRGRYTFQYPHLRQSIAACLTEPTATR